jgi:hypothetical protein
MVRNENISAPTGMSSLLREAVKFSYKRNTVMVENTRVATRLLPSVIIIFLLLFSFDLIFSAKSINRNKPLRAAIISVFTTAGKKSCISITNCLGMRQRVKIGFPRNMKAAGYFSVLWRDRLYCRATIHIGMGTRYITQEEVEVELRVI